MLKGKKILLGVTGGIAIYKVLDLISKLKKLEAQVDIIMTESATKMIAPITFQTMARSKVHTKLFESSDNYNVEHISLAQSCDIVLIAPATANIIAKIANGIADDLLSTTLLATKKPIILAHAMNSNMLDNPATKRNIDILLQRGHYFIETGTGFLACNHYGNGRMAEPNDIIDYLDCFLTKKDLDGKNIIITAGPTIERIDPVRYISNDSSGKMGYSIAKMARNRGANVILISGPTYLSQINGIETIHIETADELFEAIDDNFEDADCLIMAAAPADFKVKNRKDKKIKKTEIPELELVENKDILSYFGNIKGSKKIIGFAAETDNLKKNAKEKLHKKNLDYIIANDISKPGAGFNVDTNIASIISDSYTEDLPIMSKFDLADKILDLLKY
ncbi:MAG: bifunctional phosphopantothenoylcysteine decarboxylase/phosphopantothenate--cysteine ligase CoaBC [Tissierellia bacterium]|nr:bifunctional phosphopantothenoylcysteine decarboxylase/phosphopantothenate--cysteine ligase CoaBC [Tissierellia bacterium]